MSTNADYSQHFWANDDALHPLDSTQQPMASGAEFMNWVEEIRRQYAHQNASEVANEEGFDWNQSDDYFAGKADTSWISPEEAENLCEFLEKQRNLERQLDR